ncbi:MAG: PqiC family protein [Desulfuromonadaceae bacterium]|nr:PqiC family protein [Desulfuromonadaceae bacterium]
MRHTFSCGLLCCFAAAMTLGCSSSPRVTYYALEATAPIVSKPISPSTAHKMMPAVSVETPTVPELVDRPQLVERSHTNQIEIREFHRWAEPLRSSIPRLLADNLARQLESDQVSFYPQNMGTTADYRVFVDFQRFESEGSAVTVDALWKIRRTADGVQQTGRTRIKELTGGEGYEALVAAYSRALTAVSSDIAAAFQTEWSAAAIQK